MYTEALQAQTIEEAKLILDLDSKTERELEDMALNFAFWNGDSQVAPTEREEELANICLDELEKREQCDS